MAMKKNNCDCGPSVPSEFYQIERNITEINNHPPYPDESGFWMIWNPTLKKYKLSDIPVVLSDKEETFTQHTASDMWTINHGLNKYPAVSIVDSGGNLVYGDVEYIDLNTIKISFTSAFSGKVYLN